LEKTSIFKQDVNGKIINHTHLRQWKHTGFRHKPYIFSLTTIQLKFKPALIFGKIDLQRETGAVEMKGFKMYHQIQQLKELGFTRSQTARQLIINRETAHVIGIWQPTNLKRIYTASIVKICLTNLPCTICAHQE